MSALSDTSTNHCEVGVTNMLYLHRDIDTILNQKSQFCTKNKKQFYEMSLRSLHCSMSGDENFETTLMQMETEFKISFII